MTPTPTPVTVAMTALDEHAAHLADRLAEIAAHPDGAVARQVRDDLRRAHPVGAARNLYAVARLVRALPAPMRAGLLTWRCRNASLYRSCLP